MEQVCLKKKKVTLCCNGYLRFLNVGLILFLGHRRILLDGQEPAVSDVIFVLCTVVFFGLGILYLKGCERLK